MPTASLKNKGLSAAHSCIAYGGSSVPEWCCIGEFSGTFSITINILTTSFTNINGGFYILRAFNFSGLNIHCTALNGSPSEVIKYHYNSDSKTLKIWLSCGTLCLNYSIFAERIISERIYDEKPVHDALILKLEKLA